MRFLYRSENGGFPRQQIGGLICLLVWRLIFPLDAAASNPDFSRDVRPILAGHCFKCHGPDEGSRKSGLRLDVRDVAIKRAKSGKVAIVPEDPSKSELVRRIFTSDEDDLMPPPAAKLPLKESDKEILKNWIAAGAKYEAHWAFIKPVTPTVPTVENCDWPRNEIDSFILARLEKERLKPSAPADKYTLVRRVYLDLIGLPPTPDQAAAFVHDTRPDAYERLVDDLLASPHYGERWARRWLDLARYADTNGYEKDRPRSMWPYRDWLIEAINSDMPFDQFTIEQIAGDMLPHPTPDQIIATGFNRNTMINEEGGVDPLEYRFYSMVDRVHVTSTTWLGLTMACAQCHTHKFDPIQHTEYYQFMALLNNADEPTYSVPNPRIAAKRAKMEKKIAALEENLPNQFPPENTIRWTTPARADFSSAEGAAGEFLEDGSFRVTGKNPEKDIYTLDFDLEPQRITHVQIEAIPDESVGKGGPGRTDHGNFVLSEFEMQVSECDCGETTLVKFNRAEADASQDQFPVENAIDGKTETGWAIGAEAGKRFHRHAIFTLAEPIVLGKQTPVQIRLTQNFGGHHTIGRFRVSFGADLEQGGTIAERGRAARDRKFLKWLHHESEKIVTWKQLRPAEAKSETPALNIEDDNSVFAAGDFTKSDTYHLLFKSVPKGTTAIRLEALPDDRLPNHGPGTVHYEGPPGDFWLSTIKVHAGETDVALTNASESFASGANNAAKAIDSDLQSGWSIAGGQGRSHNAVFQFAEPLDSGGDLRIDLTFERYYAAGLGRFRIWYTKGDNARASALPNEAYAALGNYGDEYAFNTLVYSNSAATDRDLLLREFVKVAQELAPERKKIEDLRNQVPELPTTLVMRERDPENSRTTHLHHRGEFLQPKEEVKPGVPSFLPPLPSGQPANRLTLAKWLVSPENPLTARVIMNRQWEAFFGRGIVRTSEDFGFQGDLPSHPDLLDWLATEFMNRHWSVKEMHKLIVMSATYQQSSHVTPELKERDPENILLARGPRFRIDAELVRDAALVESGLISPKLGGPSVFPPQPAGVTTEGAYGALQWKVSEGGDRYRRGLYTFAKRTAPYAMTITFDGPTGEACLARRDKSNTPLQALTLLNDEVFVDCARALGRWAQKQQGDPSKVVNALFARCLTRPPTSTESQKLCDFYEAQLDRLANGEIRAAEILGSADCPDPNKTAAWTALARVLLNLDEAITKE